MGWISKSWDPSLFIWNFRIHSIPSCRLLFAISSAKIMNFWSSLGWLDFLKLSGTWTLGNLTFL
jgi:hypothetical protein